MADQQSSEGASPLGFYQVPDSTPIVMDSPAWELRAEGIVLPVQAFPGSRKNGVNGVRQGRLKVLVTQAPEKGKANDAIIEVLADALGVKRRQISLISGETNPLKKFLIVDAELAELLQRLQEVLAGL